MLSFINEIDDPIVQKDILDLNRRILRFKKAPSTKSGSAACVSLEACMASDSPGSK